MVERRVDVKQRRGFGLLAGGFLLVTLVLRLIRWNLPGGPWWPTLDATLATLSLVGTACAAVLAVAWLTGSSFLPPGGLPPGVGLVVGAGLVLAGSIPRFFVIQPDGLPSNALTSAGSILLDLLITFLLYGGAFLVALSLLTVIASRGQSSGRADSSAHDL